tara:strand:- start:3913 stop:4803 length:891 start_codon:yes stop_codon:yes gene_type:complete
MFPFRYNGARLKLYEELFDQLLANEHSEAVAANLLVDTRWAEVSRAFVNCLCRQGATGPIRPLAADYGHLVARAAELAFGTRTHAQIPSWFLQNNETFLASCLHKLLTAFNQKPAAPLQMHRAFAALFDVADGLRPFLGLRCLASSTGAHALMCAAAHSRYDFLARQESRATASLCFAEMLAERILQADENGAAQTLAFYGRSKRWQAFASERADCFAKEEAFAQLQRRVREQVPQRRGREHGLLFLASAFLDADAAAASGAFPERPSAPATPLRSAIRKRSTPFVRLVRRLVSEA